MEKEKNPSLMAAINVMIQDQESMSVGLPKLLTGDLPDLREQGGGSGFFQRGRRGRRSGPEDRIGAGRQ